MIRRISRQSGLSFSVILSGLAVLCACSPFSGAPEQMTTPEAAIVAARHSWESLNEKLNYRVPVYSKEEIAKCEPYSATLVDGQWVVRGTIPPHFRGEILETTIRRSDGSASVQVIAVD
jgi:hypothetical protein